MLRYVCTLFVSLITLGFGALANAQEAQIQGQVLDPSGASIAKALVRVVEQQTGTERKAQSNSSGQYTVPGLTPGLYKIFVEAAGFSTAMSDQITLNPGQSAVMDFTLKVGQASADVVVTAEKRGEERLLDVPIPVGVIQTDELVAQGRFLLKDYLSDVPGIAISPDFLEAQAITIRGVGASGFDNPAVGLTLDDVPFSSSTGAGGGWLIPNIDPGDLERIEVLRGPQGALYGSGSMGGLIRYVTKDPSTTAFSARFEAGTSSVHNATEGGYDIRGSVNVPINPNLAFRASGYRNHRPGYIDSSVSAQKGVNDIDDYGGRVAGLWRMSDTSSMKLTGLYQESRDAAPDDCVVGPGLGDLEENFIPGSNPGVKRVESYSTTIQTKVRPFDITSLTSYSQVNYYTYVDFTIGFGPLVQSLFPDLGYDGANYGNYYHNPKFAQELRLSSSLSDRLTYTIGGFYTREKSREDAYSNALNNLTGQVLVANFYHTYGDPNTYQESNGFGNLTYRITHKFDVQAGGRFTHENFSNPVGYTDVAGEISTAAPYASGSSVGTYLFAPTYHLLKDWMVYGRLASGFRPGTANPIPATTIVGGFVIPRQSNPDQTRDYEAGTKGSFFDRRVDLDMSGYYVDWSNIQYETRDPTNTYPYETNGGGAKSTGVEISVTARPRNGSLVSGWFAYDDAALTAAFPPGSQAVGKSGDRLPDAPKYSGNFSVDQYVTVRRSGVAFMGGQLSYVGDRTGPFVSSPVRQDFPAYTKLDFHIGARFNSWEIRGYVDNATDVRGLVGGGIGDYDVNTRRYITPRTVGISVAKHFLD